LVKYTKAEASGQSKTVELAGSTTDVFAGMNVDIAYGSQFSKSDQDRGNKRVVLGPKLAEKLFGAADNAVGKIIKLDGQAFTVCGVAKPKGGGGLGVPSIDDHVWLPYKAAYSLTQDKKFYAIYLKANSDENINAAKDEAKRLLLKRYKADDFSVIESTELLNTINQIF